MGRKRSRRKSAAAEARRREERQKGPPPREAASLRSERERRAAQELAEHHAAGPELTGGDVDADWRRAGSVGEEAVGGSVATPDQDVVDDLGEAWGVPRGPEDEIRTSGEILEGRDRHRREEEE